MNIKIQSKFRNYHVYVENQSISKIDSLIEPKRRYIVITEDGIPTIYHQVLKNKINCESIIFKQGESHKNIDTYLEVIEQLAKLSVTKSDCLIALGGGVVTDMTGYIACTYLRGIDYISIPTTLLSQIDASIGGKTSINHLGNKNLIGQIYPPLMVIIDPQTLNTLSNRQVNNGIAEMIKYGLIGSNEILEILNNQEWIKSIEKLIHLSILVKKTYIENDEMDIGYRHILNFGHTLGHAYESYYHYEKYLHGEAIAIGMVAMIENTSLKKKIIALLSNFQLPVDDLANIDDLMPYIARDKKRQSNQIQIILLKDINKAYIKTIELKNIKDYIN